MTTLPDFFAPPDADEVLRNDLMAIVRDQDAVNPRHLQKALGPSEIGHPCLRKMAYGLLNRGHAGPGYDPLPSIIGTAVHAWLFDAAVHTNARLGRQRWHAEIKVTIAANLSGTADLYDADTRSCIDWKVPGRNRFGMYRRQMSEVYRTQVHLYGKGLNAMGMPVDRVAICLLPRGGSLSSAHLWTEDYDEKIADAAIARLNNVIALLSDWEVDKHPDRFHWFAKSAPDCCWCPYWRPNPSGPLHCDGVDA